MKKNFEEVTCNIRNAIDAFCNVFKPIESSLTFGEGKDIDVTEAVNTELLEFSIGLAASDYEISWDEIKAINQIFGKDFTPIAVSSNIESLTLSISENRIPVSFQIMMAVDNAVNNRPGDKTFTQSLVSMYTSVGQTIILCCSNPTQLQRDFLENNIKVLNKFFQDNYVVLGEPNEPDNHEYDPTTDPTSIGYIRDEAREMAEKFHSEDCTLAEILDFYNADSVSYMQAIMPVGEECLYDWDQLETIEEENEEDETPNYQDPWSASDPNRVAPEDRDAYWDDQETEDEMIMGYGVFGDDDF